MENVLKARNNYILSQSKILHHIGEGAWRDDKEAFEEKIRGECGYYLNKYGTPEKQVVYYEKNNQYEQAYKIVLFKGVSQNFFAERVVKQAHVKKRLGELREIIQKMDAELTHSLDYLKIIIAFLKKNDIQDELNKFQLLVGDFYSLGDRAIEHFKDSKALKEKIRYLEEAEKYFRAFIEKPYQVKLSMNTEQDAREVLQRIKLQKDIINEYPEFIDSDIFGSEEVVFKLCKKIMVNNVKLTMEIIEKLELDLEEFIVFVFERLMKEEHDFGNIEEILKGLVTLNLKLSEENEPRVMNWNGSLYNLGIKLKERSPDFVKTKILARIVDSEFREKLQAQLNQK